MLAAGAQFTLPVGFNVAQTPPNRPLSYPSPKQLASNPQSKLTPLYASGGGGGGSGGNGGGGGGGGGDDDPELRRSLGPIGALINGWRDRVAADPQFPFKVLMEELVGVGSSVLGDMATRPNFGLNELDFVFSTLVVGAILNFMLMYLLAPTTSTAPISLPWIFSNSPPGYMFQPGDYTLLNRLGTLIYKGIVFAAVGFPSGLLGTAISNGLIKMRKKMDPSFEPPNEPPPTLLNASTWALHMGLSSNVRYQTVNGIEFLLAKALPPLVFKTSVFVLRLLNNVVGGMSFVMLARITGSQKVYGSKTEGVASEKEKLLHKDEAAGSSSSSS